MTTVTPGAVELKPCPFCWGETKIIAPLGFGNVRAVDCRNDECSATGPWARNEAEAIAAWNTRTTPPDALQTVVEALREIRDLHGEINPSNYDHDDACELNRQFVYALTIADQALAALSLAGGEHQPKGDVG